MEDRPEQRKLDILVGDFVKVDIPYFDVCISNTPYQVRPMSILQNVTKRGSYSRSHLPSSSNSSPNDPSSAARSSCSNASSPCDSSLVPETHSGTDCP
jgi:hypothetical protein